MPIQKDLKRLVRGRMQKTGESYTAARSRILDKQSPAPAEFAKLAGMSDEAVRSKTGCSWKQWVRVLDAVKADKMPHREIAKHVGESYDVTGWWAQMITVGYERIRGLREIGQQCGGTFAANKSKTFAVALPRLYKAFSTKRTRGRWLIGVEPTIRTSQVEKSMRMTWPDATSVQAYFTSKGPKKSQVAIQHSGLAGKKAVTRSKEFWAERLVALGEVLAPKR